ncbi:MAG: helix-turn-helix domain-containing protein [Deltaproteobacteria bacterium]|nr:helix-turn-helix domain-containing protein [Deltaproteobacteria bacterium]
MQCQYLTTIEAAARLGLQPRTLERWRWSGQGPAYHRLGGAVRYLADDLADWAAAGRRRSTSDPGPAPDRAAR